MQENNYTPDLRPIYDEIAAGLHRMNNNPSSEDIINFETNIGFILTVFPGSHYECTLKPDSYDQYESLTFYYDVNLDKDPIQVIYTKDC